MKTNWQIKKLGEVCVVIAGQSPEGKFYNKNGKGLPFYQGKKEFEEKYIGKPTTWTTKITKEAQEDDILMSVRAPVGPINFATQEICIGRGLASIQVGKEINKDFLFNFLQMFESEIVGNKGAVFNSISKSQIESIEISLPLLSEQKRIVKILDEVFKNIKKAKENIEKNLQNSKELFESYLQSVFENKSVSWEEKTVSDICEVEYGYTERAKSEGEYRFVRITDTDDNGLLTQEKKMYLGSFDGVGKYILNDGDLLMARTGASAGNLLIFEGDEKAVFASYLIRMLFKKEVLSKLYWYFSKSHLYWNQVRQLSAGSAQPQFNGGALKQIIFHFPKSITEQKNIIKKLNILSIETKKLEEIYKQKLADLEKLKKSVLKKAFSGEL